MRANIKITSASVKMPEYKSFSAAGADIQAARSGAIYPGDWDVVMTGLHLEIPYGYEAQIRPRSGLAAKYGITVLNAPATIDSDYRGEIGVILINHSEEEWWYGAGDRIAQLVFAPVARAELYLVDELSRTTRGGQGFGSTGVY